MLAYVFCHSLNFLCFCLCDNFLYSLYFYVCSSVCLFVCLYVYVSSQHMQNTCEVLDVPNSDDSIWRKKMKERKKAKIYFRKRWARKFQTNFWRNELGLSKLNFIHKTNLKVTKVEKKKITFLLGKVLFWLDLSF